MRQLQDLKRVYVDDCGAHSAQGERVAVFLLTSQAPFTLTQKNYARSCKAQEKDLKRYKLFSQGALEED